MFNARCQKCGFTKQTKYNGEKCPRCGSTVLLLPFRINDKLD